MSAERDIDTILTSHSILMEMRRVGFASSQLCQPGAEDHPFQEVSSPSFRARFYSALLDLGQKMYDSLLPAQLSNVLPLPPVVELDEREAELERAALRVARDERRKLHHQRCELYRQIKYLRDRQTEKSQLRQFWDSFFPKAGTYAARVAQTATAQAAQTTAPAPFQSVDALAEQFFNTPEPDYALGAGETLVVQFKPETADKYLALLEGHATITPVAKDRSVYRLSDVHLTKKGVAELKKVASFTLLVDDHINAHYDAKTQVVHFDTGLAAALARALGGRKVMQNHYVVQPHNGSTQKLLDAVQGYELPVHAIDLRNGVFVFDGRYRLPPALLNSTKDNYVVSPAVCGSGAPVCDIARRVEEAQYASQLSSPSSPN